MIKNEVLVQSPTRLDFAGGTLDCWPINAILGDVTTINVGISIYTTCRLSPRDDEKIMIHSRDMQLNFEFANLHEALACDDSSYQFYREHIRFWKPKMGFNLSTQSESPVGGGLGGSSSLSVSVFKAFSQLLSQKFDEYELVRICSGIEARILQTPTGTQDYFPPLEGGLNIIDYKNGWPQVERLPVANLNIDDHIVVFFTGRSHHSGINNWNVIKKFIEKDKQTLSALNEIRAVAAETKTVVLNKSWEKLPGLFKKEFQARMKLAESFSSPEIEKLAQIAKDSGADAINICGAGGGGCVFFWVDPKKRQKIIEAGEEAGFEHLAVELV